MRDAISLIISYRLIIESLGLCLRRYNVYDTPSLNIFAYLLSFKFPSKAGRKKKISSITSKLFTLDIFKRYHELIHVITVKPDRVGCMRNMYIYYTLTT